MKRTLPNPDVPKLKVNVRDLCANGFVWCLAEERVTKAVLEWDALEQEQRAICIFCGSRRLRTHPPVF